MSLFAAQERRKVAIVPGGIRQHFAVDTQYQPGSLWRIGGSSFILQSCHDRQPAALHRVAQRIADTISRACETRPRAGDALELGIGPSWPSERPAAKLDLFPRALVLYLDRANAPGRV